DLVDPSAIQRAGQAADVIHEMTAKGSVGRRQFQRARDAIDVAVEGLHHAEDELTHAFIPPIVGSRVRSLARAKDYGAKLRTTRLLSFRNSIRAEPRESTMNLRRGRPLPSMSTTAALPLSRRPTKTRGANCGAPLIGANKARLAESFAAPFCILSIESNCPTRSSTIGPRRSPISRPTVRSPFRST